MFLSLSIGSVCVIIFTKENDISPVGSWQDTHRRLNLYGSLHMRLLSYYIPQKPWSFRDLWFIVWNVLCQSSFCTQCDNILCCVHMTFYIYCTAVFAFDYLTMYLKLYPLNKMSWCTSLEEMQRERYRTGFIHCLIHRDLWNMFLTALVSLMEMTLETDRSGLQSYLCGILWIWTSYLASYK